MTSTTMENGHSLTKQLLVIDTDGGTDDCHGILIAAADPTTELLGLTCVMGNVGIDQVCENVLRTVHMSEKLRKAKCPIFKGAACPLAGFPIRRFNVHGNDGLGDVEHSTDLDQGLIQTKPACLALIDLVNEHPNEITIAAIGPLTNLALASRIDPSFSSKVKRLVIMGGDSRGHGNITPCAEFNFSADPEAARVVLREFTCDKTLVSWELTMDYAWDIDWMKKEILGKDTERARFLLDTNEFILELSKQDPDSVCGGLADKFPACDQLAMAISVNASLVTGQRAWRCSVETSGEYSRGHLVIDRIGTDPSLEGVTPTSIVTHVDFEVFKHMGVGSVRD